MKKIISTLSIILFLSPLAYCDTVWKDITSGIDEREFYAIAVSRDNPNVAYVAAAGGIYITKDAGISWRKSLYLGGGNNRANFVVVHPRHSNMVYAATNKGLYRSKNAGRDWERIFTGLGTKKIETDWIEIYQERG